MDQGENLGDKQQPVAFKLKSVTYILDVAREIRFVTVNDILVFSLH